VTWHLVVRIGTKLFKTRPMGTARYRHPVTGEWIRITVVPTVFQLDEWVKWRR